MSLFNYGNRESFNINMDWSELMLEHLISTTKNSETIINFIKNTIPGEVKVKHENDITTIKIKTITNMENSQKIHRTIRKLLLNDNFETKYKIEPDITITYSKILLMEIKNE